MSMSCILFVSQVFMSFSFSFYVCFFPFPSFSFLFPFKYQSAVYAPKAWQPKGQEQLEDMLDPLGPALGHLFPTSEKHDELIKTVYWRQGKNCKVRLPEWWDQIWHPIRKCKAWLLSSTRADWCRLGIVHNTYGNMPQQPTLLQWVRSAHHQNILNKFTMNSGGLRATWKLPRKQSRYEIVFKKTIT